MHRRLLGILKQAIRRAEARGVVRRNVAMLCDVPRGTVGRPSKSMNVVQDKAVLAAAKRHPAMEAYVVLSLPTGARTEELRALTWDNVDVEGEPPSIRLWRSVREGADTKTARSRRALELPQRAVEALRTQSVVQERARRIAASGCGTALSRCSPPRAWPSRTLPTSSATRTPGPPRRSTARTPTRADPGRRSNGSDLQRPCRIGHGARPALSSSGLKKDVPDDDSPSETCATAPLPRR